MTTYATVGTNKASEATAFYDKLMPVVGMNAMMDHPSGGRFYASADGKMFAVLGPYNGEEATIGNGTMIGFITDSPAKVRDFHATALELGGSCEGEPGPRGPEDMKLYFAYVRDLDGNKLCAYSVGVVE